MAIVVCFNIFIGVAQVCSAVICISWADSLADLLQVRVSHSSCARLITLTDGANMMVTHFGEPAAAFGIINDRASRCLADRNSRQHTAHSLVRWFALLTTAPDRRAQRRFPGWQCGHRAFCSFHSQLA